MGSRSPCGIAAVLPRRAPGQLGLSAFLPSREPRGAGDPASRSLWRADPATRGPSERPDRVFLLVLPFPPAARWPRRRERRGSWQRSRPPDSGSSFIFAGGEGGGVREGGDEGGIKTNNSDPCKGQTGQRPQGLPPVSFCRKGLVPAEPAPGRPASARAGAGRLPRRLR